jgi:hypothetical protein
MEPFSMVITDKLAEKAKLSPNRLNIPLPHSIITGRAMPLTILLK